MCFAKSTPKPMPVEIQQPVVRHEANASLTKNNKEKTNKAAFAQNVKTSPTGLEYGANTQKKTLLGE